MDCGLITKTFVGGNCGKLPIGGTGVRVMLINYADIASHDTTEDGVINAIRLVSGKKGYLYESIENSALGEANVNRGTCVKR